VDVSIFFEYIVVLLAIFMLKTCFDILSGILTFTVDISI